MKKIYIIIRYFRNCAVITIHLSVVDAIPAITVDGNVFVRTVFLDRCNNRLVTAFARIWVYQGQAQVGGGGEPGSGHARPRPTDELQFRGKHRRQPSLVSYPDDLQSDFYSGCKAISKQKH